MESGATISPWFVYIWNQFEGCLCLWIYRWYLLDFWGKLWVCMHGWGGRNWNYHWKNSSANQHMPRFRLRLSLMILFPSIYNVTVSVKENKMEGETITEKIPEASFMHKVLGCGRWWPRCFSKLCLKSNLVKKGGLPADPRFQWGIEPWSHYLLHGDWSLYLFFSVMNQDWSLS